jgi:hypothetical protein
MGSSRTLRAGRELRRATCGRHTAWNLAHHQSTVCACLCGRSRLMCVAAGCVQDNGFAPGPVEFEGFVVQAQEGKDAKRGQKGIRSGSPGQRRRGNSPGQRQSRLPGLNGANGPGTNGGPRQRTPYQMENSNGLNGQRRPTPRRGARGTGFSPRGNQQAQQQGGQRAQQQQAQGWTTGSEAPGHVTTAKLSPRKGTASAQNEQRTSPETDPPDSPPQDEVRAGIRLLCFVLLAAFVLPSSLP